MATLFTLSINLDLAAFDGMSEWSMIDRDELARTLRRVADRVADGLDDGTVWDRNGNDAGSFSIET